MNRPRRVHLLPALAFAAAAPFAAAQPGATLEAPAEIVDTAELLGAAADAVANDEPAWSLALDLRRVMASPFASSLMAAAEQAGQPADFAAFEAETGLDARTDIGAIVLSGTSFEDDDGTLVADLGGSGGRLEAYFAEQPDHAVSTLADGTKLHSFSMENPAAAAAAGLEQPEAEGAAPATPVWAALRETPAGVRLVAASTEEAALRITSADDLEDRLAPARVGGERLLSVRVPEVPENAGQGMPMGGEAINAIRGMVFAIDSGEEVSLDLRLDTADDADATQLQQTIQAFAGMVPMMAPSMGLTPDDTQQLMTAMQSLNVAAEPGDAGAEPGVRLRFAVPQETVDEWMEAAKEAAATQGGM